MTDDISKWWQNHPSHSLSVYMFLFSSDPLPESSKVPAMLPVAFLMLESIEEVPYPYNNLACQGGCC